MRVCNLCPPLWKKHHKYSDRITPARILKERKHHRRQAAIAKAKILLLLGNRCVACGMDDPRVLCIDHKHGDGYQERKSGIKTGYKAYKIIQKDPDRFQLLCANCNLIKALEIDPILRGGQKASTVPESGDEQLLCASLMPLTLKRLEQVYRDILNDWRDRNIERQWNQLFMPGLTKREKKPWVPVTKIPFSDTRALKDAGINPETLNV